MNWRTPTTVALLIAGFATTSAAQAAALPSRLLDSVVNKAGVATEDTWRRLSSLGLPIVEPIPGDSAHRLVTFVWKGDSATRNVVLITPLTLVDFRDGVMTRARETDLWYKSITLPNDSRFAYRFAPNDNLIPFERDTNIAARMATMRRDTMNSKTFDYGFGGLASVLELPGAPSDALIHPRPSVARGAVTATALASRILGSSRRVWVYTPPLYALAVDKGLPLLVFMDGESYQRLIPTPTILDNLIADGTIPPVIAVFIDNPPDAREGDLNCNNRWSDFLANELVPWADTHYRTTRERARRIVVGYSLGGLGAACAAIHHSNVFGNVVAQSGSFYRAPSGEPPEWVARHLAASRRLPVRFVLSIGRFETAPIPSRDPSMLTATRHLRDVLLAKGYDVRFRELSSGHEQLAWRATLGPALIQLLRPTSRNDSAR
jgi:enterochelin esterase family protein